MALVPYVNVLAPYLSANFSSLLSYAATAVLPVVSQAVLAQTLMPLANKVGEVVEHVVSRCMRQTAQQVCDAPKKIAILPKFSRGMGDLAAMRKMYLHLQECYQVQIVIPAAAASFVLHFPELAPSIVTFDPKVGPEPDADLAISFPDNIESDNFASVYADNNIRLLRLREAGYSPESFLAPVIAKLRQAGITTEEGVSTYLQRMYVQGVINQKDLHNLPIQIRESGFFTGKVQTVQNSGVHALGVGPSEIGLMLDRDIIEYVKLGSYRDPIQRLGLLKELPDTIIKAIFANANFANVKGFSQEAVAVFHRTAKLYFSYSEEESASLIFSKAMVDLEKAANLTFVFVRSKPAFFAAKTIQDLATMLDLTSVDQVKFIWGRKQEFLKTIAHKIASCGNKARQLTFISLEEGLSHPQFQALLKASERECLVRGEQSFFDAVLLRKIPVNELSIDKSPMIHGLIQAASKVQKALTSPLHKLFKTLLSCAPQIRARLPQQNPVDVLSKVKEGIVEARRLGTSWDKLAQMLESDEHNFFLRLDTLVNPC